MKFRHTAIAAVALSLVTHSSFATDPAGMQKLFDDIGAYSSISGPGAYQSQSMNIISGGNVFVRIPPRNIRPIQIDLPSLKAGCGGIDLYAGSFSFINKEALVAMMKNIGAGAVSFAFKLALDSISPQINKTITELQQTVQQLNAMNINSCEAGSAIAQGIGGNMQATQQYFAKVAGPITGLFDDHSATRATTQGDNAETTKVLAAVTDPKMKSQFQPGNIAWKALSRIPGVSDEDKQVLMAMSGTMIVQSNKIESPPEYFAPKSITIRQFIHGNDSATLDVYTCTDGWGPDACLTLGEGTVKIEPYGLVVHRKLTGIADKIKGNIKLSDPEIQFVNATNLPVFKALAVATARPSLGLDQAWIANYSDLIAAEYAYYFITQLSAQLRTAYSQARNSAPGPIVTSFEVLLANVDKAKGEAREEVKMAYSTVKNVNIIADEIVRMERNMLASLPANLAGNLRFGAK